MFSKASLIIVVIHVPSGTTKDLPTCARVATIRVVRYGWILPTSLVSRTLWASLQATSNKRVLPGPLHLPPSPLGMVSKRAAAMCMLLPTSTAIVVSHLAKQLPTLVT